jgi:hypothetical protein
LRNNERGIVSGGGVQQTIPQGQVGTINKKSGNTQAVPKKSALDILAEYEAERKKRRQ